MTGTPVTRTDSTPIWSGTPGGGFIRRIRRFLTRASFRYDVFISYSHEDSKYASALKKALEARDYTCFIDYEGSPPGQPLRASLDRALRRSAVLVVVASQHALRSEYVELEIATFSE